MFFIQQLDSSSSSSVTASQVGTSASLCCLTTDSSLFVFRKWQRLDALFEGLRTSLVILSSTGSKSCTNCFQSLNATFEQTVPVVVVAH